MSAAALLLAFSSVMLLQHAKPERSQLVSQIVRNPDYEVIDNLDELVAFEENTLWIEDSVD
jgi:hypothetical protein